jgi:hypothetical protein
MLGSAVLDTAIGLVFIYIIFSLFMTIVREEIERRLKTRAADLEQGIRQLMHDPSGSGLTKLIYNHPFVYSLYHGDYEPRARKWNGARKMPKGEKDCLPNYIPARNFALALLDLFNDPATASPGATFRSGVPLQRRILAPAVPAGTTEADSAYLDTSQVARALDVAIRANGGDPAKVQLEVEGWFNSVMDRISGVYKRRTQRILLWAAFALALACNVNTIGLVQTLAANQGLRDAIVSQAEREVSAGTLKAADRAALQERQEELKGLGLPLGWSRPQLAKVTPWNGWDGLLAFLELLVGCWLTALAISLGAPFWFDVLNRLMVIRATVKPHEKSPEELSQDGGKVAADPASRQAVERETTPSQVSVRPKVPLSAEDEELAFRAPRERFEPEGS